MEAIIFIGLQAAGKSTFYRERFFNSHLRISLDLLRTRNRERALLAWCIQQRQPFVIDNTNPTVAEREVYIEAARASGFRVIGYVFEAHVTGSIARNAARVKTERVPEQAIPATKKRLEWPSLAEGFDTLHYVRLNQGGGFILEEWRDAI